jgi:3-dehydroquinate dehydratase/shikimate dehydrogenase
VTSANFEFPKLCLTIAELSVEGVRRRLAHAAAAGAMAEIRLDFLVDFDASRTSSLAPLCDHRSCPVLLTFRRPCDGGRREVDDDTRLRLLASAAGRYAELCDIEHDLAGRAAIDPGRLVLSHHDFSAVTPNLSAIYERMREHPAFALKIAVMSREERDVVGVFELLGRANLEGRRLLAIAMGTAGRPSRLLGPAWGAPWTYCTPDDGDVVAPGQPRLGEARELYRVGEVGPDTVVFGLAAGDTSYSLSPRLHNRMFRKLGINAVYLPFDVTDFGSFADAYVSPPRRRVPWLVRGVSVTNPHKVAAAAAVDRLDPLAALVGAVNTIVVEGERLIGYNTDVEGCVRPLERRLGSLAGLRIGVLGTGGAARAAAAGFGARGAVVTVFGRHLHNAEAVAAVARAVAAPWEAAGAEPQDVLVNATPLGTQGPLEGQTPLERAQMRGTRVAYDLVYTPRETVFLREAAAAGCETLGGLGMLVEQAALQFELWTGQAAPIEAMLAAAL